MDTRETREKLLKLKQMFIENPNLVLITHALLRMGMKEITLKHKGESLTFTRQELLDYAVEILKELWKETNEGGQP
jgi:hypothetical protein